MWKTILSIVIAIIVIVLVFWWFSAKQESVLEQEETIEDQEEIVVFQGERELEVKQGEEFSIVLEANPTTGYQWGVDYEKDYLELVDRKYEVLAQEGIVGAGGEEIFKFKALKSGITEITFSYLRPWEVSPIEERVYNIVID